MSKLTTIAELNTLRANLIAANPNRPYISVCGGTGCRVYGSEKFGTPFAMNLYASAQMPHLITMSR